MQYLNLSELKLKLIKDVLDLIGYDEDAFIVPSSEIPQRLAAFSEELGNDQVAKDIFTDISAKIMTVRGFVKDISENPGVPDPVWNVMVLYVQRPLNLVVNRFSSVLSALLSRSDPRMLNLSSDKLRELASTIVLDVTSSMKHFEAAKEYFLPPKTE